MWNKKVTAVFTWVLFCGLFSSFVTACHSDWFGSSCQYKCHCTNNNCDDNGSCTSGSKCVDGWFGPTCQYANLATNETSSEESVTDNDDTTCIDNVNIQEVRISFANSTPFTWMRIQFKDPDQVPIFQLQFKPHEQDSVIGCQNQRKATVTKTSIDIHCDLDVAVDVVILNGEGAKSLCSIYISGGRNVALKQTTSQSSNYETNEYPSKHAVDGDISTFTHTDRVHDFNPKWTLTLARPNLLYLVNRYAIYNRQNCCPERLKGFILQSFTENGSIMFNYTDKETSPQHVYNVISVGIKQPVSHVTIQATYLYSTKYPLRKVLSLGEVEVYGESACPNGKYGLECNQMCSCDRKDETCFVSTGGCPSGCASGFYGEDCQTACPIGKYGSGCQRDCSEYCKRNLTVSTSVCNRETGQCLHGCIKGYEGDTCTIYTKDKSAESSTADNSGLKIGVGVSCALLVIAIIVIIIVVLWLRRVKKSRKESTQQPGGYDNVEASQEDIRNYRTMYVDADGYNLPRNHDNVQASQDTGTYEGIQENVKDAETGDNETKHYEDIRDEPQTTLASKDCQNFSNRKGKDGESDYENQMTVAENVRQDVLYENENYLDERRNTTKP